MSHSNKNGKPPAESEEGRPLITQNTHQSNPLSTPSVRGVAPGLAAVRQAAREWKEMKFIAGLHRLTTALLRDGFYALKRSAPPGAPGGWPPYAPNRVCPQALQRKSVSLERFHTGTILGRTPWPGDRAGGIVLHPGRRRNGKGSRELVESPRPCRSPRESPTP